jgi:hypothetical protein
MAAQAEATRINFRFLEEKRIHEVFDNHGVEGLRHLVNAVLADCDAIEQLAEDIENGGCYAIDPDRVRSWWGWG